MHHLETDCTNSIKMVPYKSSTLSWILKPQGKVKIKQNKKTTSLDKIISKIQIQNSNPSFSIMFY